MDCKRRWAWPAEKIMPAARDIPRDIPGASSQSLIKKERGEEKYTCPCVCKRYPQRDRYTYNSSQSVLHSLTTTILDNTPKKSTLSHPREEPNYRHSDL